LPAESITQAIAVATITIPIPIAVTVATGEGSYVRSRGPVSAMQHRLVTIDSGALARHLVEKANR
jgi:hypothetical protein